MNKAITLLTIAFQLTLTFFLTFVIFMIFSLYDFEGGFDNIIGLIIFQPMLAVIFSIATIVICFTLGLPIRLNKAVNSWWAEKWFIPLILISLGFIMLFISFTPSFLEQAETRIEGLDRADIVPNRLLSASGWFLTAFGALHIYPPVQLTNILKSGILKLLDLVAPRKNQ